jgi:phage terminase large subunit-like protein
MRWTPAWHRRLDRELVNLPFHEPHVQGAIRRAICEDDPVAFARIYLHDHLVTEETGNQMTFSEVHYEWAELARGWRDGLKAEPEQDREAFIAPRGMGKSTWWFLILPLWGAAFGHVQFAAAFAHAASQAENHLKTLKHELDTNPLLQHDFPDLCTPLRKPSGSTVSDNMGMLRMRNGFTFAARGIDAASLGMKVGKRRPDLLILDDVEPDEASYSPDQMRKRLGTILDAVFPLNIYARVVMVGTVTMPGSIMHQLVKSAAGKLEEDGAWVTEAKIKAHHHHPITWTDEGEEASCWPAKWPLDWLQSIRHTRQYAKNYANDPMAREGLYWLKEDFRVVDPSTLNVTRTLLAVDPAVTRSKTSDFTGLAVVGYDPVKRKAIVLDAWGVKLTGTPLRNFVVDRVLPAHPTVTLIHVETNQGGDLWAEVFGCIPGVRYRHHTATVSKEIRFAANLVFWQRGRVVVAREIPRMMEEAIAFPNGAYDDVIDAAVAGVDRFLRGGPRVKESEHSYV